MLHGKHVGGELTKCCGATFCVLSNHVATSKTIVCIASDHGEMLGDHGDVDKSKPWEGSAHVPLMCAGPGIIAGQTLSLPVATMDMVCHYVSSLS